MNSAEQGWVGSAFRIIAAVGLLYLLLPILMVFPLSVEPGQILRYPPQGFSLHWYRAYFGDREWLESTFLSFKVAIGAAAIATAVGTLAAIGLTRASQRLRNVSLLILMSPIFLPTIVVSVAIYGLYASLRLVGNPLGLIAAHAVLTIPFVVLNVATALVAVPRSLEEAAMSLGAGNAATLHQITIPLIAKGIAAGAVFSFLVSFDEVVIAMFLSGVHTVTLPKRMLESVFYEISPMLAAISVVLIAVNVVLVLAGLTLIRSRASRPV